MTVAERKGERRSLDLANPVDLDDATEFGRNLAVLADGPAPGALRPIYMSG
jgi:hypothetical protein